MNFVKFMAWFIINYPYRSDLYKNLGHELFMLGPLVKTHIPPVYVITLPPPPTQPYVPNAYIMHFTYHY